MATIYFWYGQELNIPYYNGQKIDDDKVFDIAKEIFQLGLNVMIKRDVYKNIRLFVDDKGFATR